MTTRLTAIPSAVSIFKTKTPEEVFGKKISPEEFSSSLNNTRPVKSLNVIKASETSLPAIEILPSVGFGKTETSIGVSILSETGEISQ